MRPWVTGVMVVILAGGCAGVPKTFQPQTPIPAEEFSHEAFDQVLRDHVRDGVVNYPGIAADARFADYLRLLDRVDPNGLPSRDARLAFWINAYNAFAIKGILDGYSPQTGFGQYRYFIARRYQVGGASLNLYDLERELLIPEFKEPRIHFAIVCASRSCPRLRSRAYTAETLEEQLDEGARAFVNDPARNRFDREHETAHLSKIFDWFEDDFVAHSGSLIEYVRQYVSDPGLVRELDPAAYSVKFMEYDWRLNGPAPVEVSHADPR